AREKFIEYLRKNGLIEKEEKITQNVGTSDRFKDPVEVLPMEQWFVDVNKDIPGRDKSLKDLMREAVTVGHNNDPKQKIEITPERFQKNYLQWIDNLRDWCISRQIWWGHRIPVWYSDKKTRKQENKKTNESVEITYYVHGTTVDNENDKASGQYDVELSKLGIKQSKELKKLTKDKKFDVVFCSDLKRAVDSAEMAFGGKFKIIKDKRLRECDYGDMTGCDNKKVEAIEKEIIDTPFPGGESYREVEERIKNFFKDVQNKYKGKKIAIIAHKAPQLALEVLLNDKTWEKAIDEDWRKKKAWQPGWEYISNNSNSACVDIYVGDRSPKGDDWEQDPDTLDTWFSSGLWTFSTLGWPNETSDLKKFHPTTFMQMGYEILFFWMARMILMSTYGLNEIPFKDVYIHGMLRNEKGKKFSKSDKTGTDPLELIEQYGTDALRLSLLLGTTAGNDSKFYEEKMRGSRNFVNKLWNVSRFILMSVDEDKETRNKKQETRGDANFKNLSLSDKWILSELNIVIREVTKAMDEFQFSRAGETLYEFTWTKLADWYLEISKVETGKDGILIYILTNLLKLWHPFAPFVTETIWQQLMPLELPARAGDSRPQGRPEALASGQGLLMVQKWPKADEKLIDAKSAAEFEKFQELVTTIRNKRADKKIEPREIIKVGVKSGKYEKLVKGQKGVIERLGRCEIAEKGEIEI
ncbi:class I tRNA ligase family protein, partial [Patescibacteria group bacterium]|nr:class I tRNA ligase family protein [Patescibacteria group bacterium]